MKVSVIIPGYRSEYIAETLQSLFNQTVQPHEIVYIQDKECSAVKINKMLEMVTGDAVINLGDDDTLAPDYIEKTVRAMEENNVDIVYTDLMFIGDRTGRMDASDYTVESFKRTNPIFVTHLARKKVYDRANGWDKNIRYADWDFNYRLFKTGATAYHLKEALFNYRIHPAQDTVSVDVEKSQREVISKHPELV